MKNNAFTILAACAMVSTAHVGRVFAYDTFYYVDSGDHDMAAAANWRLNSATGEVPATFPPTLDTATSGKTHPLLSIPAGSTLSLPNNNSLTVNWLSVQDPNADCTIDLGSVSKTIYLFGGADASFWVGGNYPNGQKITLKSGTIQRCAGTTRRSNIRLGAAPASRGALATFIADGTDARIVDMQAALDSGNVLFCITNGATFLSAQGSAVNIGTGVDNAVFRVAGAGSLFAMTDRNRRGFMLGDSAPAATPVPSGGTVEVVDGGAVSNIWGAIGNNSGYHAVLVDNGNWYAFGNLDIGANATADNNRMVIRNNSRYVYAAGIAKAPEMTVGSSGHGNSLHVEDSDFEANALYVGLKNGASGNSAVFSNARFLAPTTVHVGGKTTDGSAFYATNNALSLIDCRIGSAESPSVDIVVGSGAYACSNRLDLVRTEWYPAGAYLGIGGAAGSSSVTLSNQWFNVMRLDDHSLVSYPRNYTYFGRGGCSNRLEVANSSTLDVNHLEIGTHTATQICPTSGNQLYVGKDSLVRVAANLVVYPERARLVMGDGTLRVESVIVWHRYYSSAQGIIVENLNNAEADGVTFDTELAFMGSKPRLEFTNAGRDLGFDAGERLSFELPESPYAAAAIYGARNVNFTNVAGYSFDLSRVGKAGGKYVLAEAAGTLTVNAADLTRMNAALPSDRNANISVDGKQLILKVGNTFGFTLTIQ